MSEEPTLRTPRDPAPRQVLDPAWEDELRAGQEQDGGAGSVDEELAALHLLRHLREPEALSPDDLEGIWRSMEPQLRPKPWWQRAWFFVGAPALAGGAALLLVLATPPSETVHEGPRIAAGSAPTSTSTPTQTQTQTPTPTSTPRSRPSTTAARSAASPDAALTASASALLLEQHFAVLEPGARRELAGRVDVRRAQARGDLLARAQGSRS